MSREEHVFMAKLAEESECYDDLVEFMKLALKEKQGLTRDEANLLSVGYKYKVGNFRNAWRNLTLIGQREMEAKSEWTEVVAKYRRRVEMQMEETCREVIGILDSELLPYAEGVEALCFYWKMKADYFRYLSEVAESTKFSQVVAEALNAYEEASKLSNDLPEAHPVRLGVALNFSVFYYEALEDPAKACELAQAAIDMCCDSIDSLPEEQGKDSLSMLQLLRDNLQMWNIEYAEEGGPPKDGADLDEE